MRIQRWFIAACAGLVMALFAPELIQAQGGPPPGVPPRFPPGLHDRALPPGNPFSGGGFVPPGQGQGGQSAMAVSPAMLAVANQSAAGLTAAIQGGTFDPGSSLAHSAARELAFALEEAEAKPLRLVAAVESYNTLIRSSSEGFLYTASPDLRAVRRALLELPGVTEPATNWGEGMAESPGEMGLSLDEGSFEARSATDAADRVERLRQGLLLEVSDGALQQVSQRWTMPGLSANTPLGFGAEWGHVWSGVSYQPRARRADGHTGAAAVGFGLGDASRYAGLQLAYNSFSTVSSGFFNRNAVDLHLHRRLPGGFGVAVGWESALTWGQGDVTKDSGSNRYAVASRWFTLNDDPNAFLSGAMLSVGVGDGRFQSERDFMEGRDGVGLFGSAAVRVAPPLSVMAEWTGQDLMLAGSITPLRNHQVGIIAGVTDVTGAAGDGARFVLGMSAGHSFR